MRVISSCLGVLAGACLGCAALGYAQAPAAPATQPAPTAAAGAATLPKKLSLDCSAQAFGALFCKDLSTLFDSPNTSLSTDHKSLNEAAGQVGGAVTRLMDPLSTSAAIFAFARPAAVEDEATQYANALKQFEATRLDKQVGSAAPSATASTDVVAKAGAAGLLSLATETGAFTQAVNGNTFTLNGNPWNAIQLARTGQLYEAGLRGPKCVNPLRTTNLSASFTVDQSSTKTAPSSGGANGSTQDIGSVLLPTSGVKFSAITVQTNVWHSQDPASRNYQSAWSTAFENHKTELQKAGSELEFAAAPLQELLGKSDVHAELMEKQERAGKVLARDIELHDGRQLVIDYANYLEEYRAFVRSQDPEHFNTLITNAAARLAAFVNLNQSVINEARGKPMLTLEYTFSQPVSQPSTHNLRVVFGEQSKMTGAQITFNGAASFYQGRPADAKYGPVKDVQVSGQFDYAAGNKQAPPLVVSVAGYGQYQSDPSVLNITSANLAPGTDITLPANAQQFLGSAGWLGVVQGKATLRLQKSISIPLAIKWSNKTELLDSPDTRGQIGLSYDFTSLVSLLKGK